jgi:hypothetical protein
MNIIFMYKGDTCDYMQWTLAQARDASSSHRVICISDRKWGVDGVEYYDWDYYAEGTKWFEELLHGEQDTAFYRRSFVRPAIARNFCQDKGIGRYFNADADVIVTCNLDEVCGQWDDCDFTISLCNKATGRLPGFDSDIRIGHTNHSIMTLKAIDDYIEFARQYSADHKAIGCDMMVWSAFAARTNLKWVDTAGVLDHNIGTQLDDYENDGTVKTLRFFGSQVMKTRKDGTLEPVNVIHAWSGTKAFIGEWCKQIGH